MRSLRRRASIATAVVATVVGAGACADKSLAPRYNDAAVLTVRATLAAQTNPVARVIDARVVYDRTGGSHVEFVRETVAVPTDGAGQDGSRQIELPLRVDLTACLADASRLGSRDACTVRIIVVVRTTGGVMLDSAGTAPIDATSGAAPTIDAVTLRTVATVTVAPDTATLSIGDSTLVVVSAREASGTPINRATTFGTSDATVATVSGTGFVRTVGVGQVTITATMGGTAGSATYKVAPRIAGAMTGRGFHSCVLDATGRAFCWGQGTNGALGNGTTTNSNAPVAVSGSLRFVGLSSGPGITCGRTNNAALYCWGFGHTGLFAAAATQATTPRLVTTPVPFAAVAPGSGFSCGLTAQGVAHCWGANTVGELGRGTNTPSELTPAPVAGGLSFIAIGTFTSGLGGYACALTAVGTMYCWGANSAGNLGNGTLTATNVPTQVTGGVLFTSMSVGFLHACALTATGDAYCWGSNIAGRLGDGTAVDRLVPVPVVGGLKFTQISAGPGPTCAIAVGGAAYCWGLNDSGQLGTGTPPQPGVTPNPVPVAVAGGHQFALIDASSGRVCGVTVNGDQYCWGSNQFGGLGTGTAANSVVPVRVVGGVQVITR